MLKYFGFRLSAALAQRLPERVAYRLADVGGPLFYLLNSGGRDAVIDNMRHVLGVGASPAGVRRAARGVFHNITLNYVDVFRLPVTSRARLDRDRLVLRGEEHLTAAIAAGRGIIACSAHFGSPDLAVQALCSRGVRATILTEPLTPPALWALINELRSSAGQDFEPVTYSTIREALRTLRRGGLIGVMIDRDVQGRGIVIDLLGRPARVPTGAAELALRTGALLLPVFSRRRIDNRIEVCIEPAVEPPASVGRREAVRLTTEALVARFVPHLRADPDQWIVLERVWDGAAPHVGYTGAGGER